MEATMTTTATTTMRRTVVRVKREEVYA